MAGPHDPNAGCLPTRPTIHGIYTPHTTLPLGRWQGMANGRRFNLNITSVSGITVEGDYDGFPLHDTHWDADTQKLTFVRLIPDVLGDGTSGDLRQLFTGYLMYYDEEIEIKWRLAGTFKGTLQKPGDLPDSPESGWYATLPMKGPQK